MGEFIKTWITNIIAVVIFISFIEILMPNSSLKKYLNLVLGFIVILVIANPIIFLIKNQDELVDDAFKVSIGLREHEYELSVDNIENIQREQLLKLYRDNLSREIKERLIDKFDVNVLEIDLDLDDINMGRIREVKLSLSEREEKSNSQEIAEVSINIGEESKGGKELTLDEGKKSEIIRDISRILDINEARIIIN